VTSRILFKVSTPVAWTNHVGLVGWCGWAFASLGFAGDAKYKPPETNAAAERATDLKMLSLEVSHALSRESAKRRMELLIQRWERKYGLRSSWSGDTARLSGTILGISLQATLEVNDQSVRGEANDPGILFRNKAKKYLQEKLGLYLDPSKTPEGLEQSNS
jgi:putative polyhydroxyalkanoic acid system protein